MGAVEGNYDCSLEEGMLGWVAVGLEEGKLQVAEGLGVEGLEGGKRGGDKALHKMGAWVHRMVFLFSS